MIRQPRAKECAQQKEGLDFLLELCNYMKAIGYSEIKEIRRERTLRKRLSDVNLKPETRKKFILELELIKKFLAIK